MSTLRPAAGGLFTDGRRLLRAAALITGVNGPAYLALAGPLEDLLGPAPGPSGRSCCSMRSPWGRCPRPPGSGAAPPRPSWRSTCCGRSSASRRPPLNPAGRVWAPLQAAVVAGFAAVQYAALRRTR